MKTPAARRSRQLKELIANFNLDRWFGQLPQAVVVMLGAGLAGLLGFLDYQTGSEFSLSVFYLLPILFVTWYANYPFGVLLAIASVSAWILPGLANGTIQTPISAGWNFVVRTSYFLITAFFVDQLKTRLEHERSLASADSLTLAANHRSFYEAVEREISRARRNGTPFTVVYFDIDNFKRINDEYGHLTGDHILIETVNIIKANLRAIDVIGRMGGDEFAIIFPSLSFENAEAVMQRICSRVYPQVNKYHPVTFSVGAVAFLHPPATVDDVLKEVDRVMYISKTHGKNQCRLEVWRYPESSASDD